MLSHVKDALSFCCFVAMRNSCRFNCKYALTHSRFCFCFYCLAHPQLAGHRHPITCLAALKCERVVATGDSAPRPTVHVWSADSLDTLRVISGHHVWGISCISFAIPCAKLAQDSLNDCFSNCNHLLAVVGADNCGSVTLYNWRAPDDCHFGVSERRGFQEHGSPTHCSGTAISEVGLVVRAL